MDQPDDTQWPIDQAMIIAVACLRADRLREAAAICATVLDADPRNPDALHYSGVLAHKLGHTADGIELMERSLALVPDKADWHNNFGILVQSTGDIERAADAFRRAIEIDPRHANAHANLGVLQRILGQLEASEASYRRSIELDPANANTYFNLAILLDQTGRTPDALTAYCKALTLKPSHADARRHLALAYALIGEREKSIELCEEWVREDPDDPRARHALAAYSGRDVPERCADDYVQVVFDSFAETFEAKLKRLDYRAPELVAGMLARVLPAPARALDVLDVGCGTGLCAPLLAPYAKRLVGVDLSEGMIEHARAKQLYDELVQSELTAYLRQQQAAFDVIVSADTLVYFGALDAVAAAAAHALRPGGAFVFTVEEAVDTDAPYAIQLHGRYCHHASYVEQVLRDAGLEPAIERAELRKESGLPVPGLVVRATAAASARPLTFAAATSRPSATSIGGQDAEGD